MSRLVSPKPSLGSTLRGDISRTHLEGEAEHSRQRSQVSLDQQHCETSGNEKTSPPEERHSRKSTRDEDPLPVREKEGVLVVDWDGPDDPANPKKYALHLDLKSSTLTFVFSWTQRKKWSAALTMSMFTFMSPVASSMVAPAAFQIAQDLHITRSIEVSMTVSIYVLAYGEY